MSGQGAAPSGAVLVPVARDENGAVSEVLEVLAAEMPNAENFTSILGRLEAPPQVWVDAVRAYAAEGRGDEFAKLSKVFVENLEVFQQSFTLEEATVVEVFMHCAIAEHCVTQAGDPGLSSAEQGALFKAAEDSLKSALLAGPQEQLPYVGRGLLELRRPAPKYDRAETHFRRAANLKNAGEKNVAPHVGLGICSYAQKKWGDALRHFAAALKQCPSSPPFVRLAIGACHFKLGNLDSARAAFLRTLDLDPASADAHVALATMDLNAAADATAAERPADAERHLTTGLSHTVQALKCRPAHPGALYLLSCQALVREQYERAAALAEASAGALAGDVQAEAQCVVGRSRHALASQEPDSRKAVMMRQQAMQAYRQAAGPRGARAALPHLGLSQLFLSSRQATDTHNAVVELDRALSVSPADPDVLAIAGRLCPAATPAQLVSLAAHVHKVPLARVASTRSLEVIAELLAATDLTRARAVLDEAVARHRPGLAAVGDPQGRAAGGESPALWRLFNNAAVLRMHLGEDLEGARALLTAAREELEAAGGGAPAAVQVTLSFNDARLCEAEGRYADARRGYEEILAGVPGMAECYVRLASIARASGDHAGALERLAAADAHCKDDVDVLGMRALLLLEDAKHSPAKECVDAVLKKKTPGGVSAQDQYMTCMKGAINVAACPPILTKLDDRKRAEYARTAATCYEKVLSHPEGSGNLVAAAGMGMALMMRGGFKEAADVLGRVVDAASVPGSPALPEALVSLGTCHLAMGDALTAVKLYRTALRKFYKNGDTRVMLFLARALHDAGRGSEARVVLARALHVDPTNHTLRYNAAYELQHGAMAVLQDAAADKLPHGDEVRLVNGAAEALAVALRHLRALAELEKAQTRLSSSMLQVQIAFCSSNLEQAQKLCERAAARAAQRQAVQAKVREKLEAQQAMEAAQKALEAARRRAEEGRRLKVAEEEKKRTQVLRARLTAVARGTVATERAEEGDGDGEAGGGDDAAERGSADERELLKGAGLDSDSDDEAGAPANGAGGASAEAAEAAEAAGGADTEDADAAAGRKRERSASPPSAPADAAGEDAAGPEAKRPRALVDSDDE
ncbi:unnamed protein product [Pedinophyceae sp. YPF-701]|nr:unnamed protein product [Pedinophyceae sp. YPF-701]